MIKTSPSQRTNAREAVHDDEDGYHIIYREEQGQCEAKKPRKSIVRVIGHRVNSVR